MGGGLSKVTLVGTFDAFFRGDDLFFEIGFLSRRGILMEGVGEAIT